MTTDIAAQIAQGEGTTVEFKTSLSDSRKIIETIAALATQGGGVIIIGVRDDGTPVGANIGQGEHERLVQQILANTDPRLFVKLDEPSLSGQKLLRITVPPGDGPHLAFGRAFHRVGRATVAMTRDEYERRLLDRLRESSGYERRPVEGVDRLDPAAVHHWLDRARPRLALHTAADPSAAELLERLHLAPGGRLSVAGWLLFGAEPQAPFPQAVIRARAERGASVDSLAVEGGLCRQIEDAVAFVARNLRVQARIRAAVREEQPELPLVAVREAVANAVAHRDYRSAAAIQLHLTDAGLTLWNPGHFPPPITPGLLRERHPSVPPNPLLARALYLAGYVEEWGTGTLRIIEAMRANGNPEPTFSSSSEGGVLVTLPMGAPAVAQGERERLTLARFVAGKPFSSADYARRAKVSVRTAGLDLKGLEAGGLVRRVGVGRATRWVKA